LTPPMPHVTKLKILLPVGKEKTWRLMATTKGLESWFPTECHGTVKIGSSLEFVWPNHESESFPVLYVGEKHSALSLGWRKGGRLRFYLHGRLTTLTLQLEYPRTVTDKTGQAREIGQLAFFLANLKSVALKGPDLRSGVRRKRWDTLFLD